MAQATPPPSTAKRHGRRPTRQTALLKEMRHLIVSGQFAPGARVPTRTELQKRFAASCITVQRVVDRLGRDGLVQARGTQGTFVVERPPHLYRVVLVFPFGPDISGQWNSYYAALARAANALRRDGAVIEECYATERGLPTPAFERLQLACRDGLLAGLVFASPPEIWAGMPASDAPLPRVTLAECRHPTSVNSYPDQASFIALATAELARAGCRRPAVITTTEVSEFPNRWAQGFAAAGIALRPQWLLGADLLHPTSATRLARLLAAPWAGERPDGLVIADDTLEPPVLAGLMAEGVKVGSEMVVLAHANFPLQGLPPAPLVRLGFDVATLLRHAVAGVLAMRAGHTVAPLLLPATLADRA